MSLKSSKVSRMTSKKSTLLQDGNCVDDFSSSGQTGRTASQGDLLTNLEMLKHTRGLFDPSPTLTPASASQDVLTPISENMYEAEGIQDAL